ncbi:MAG: FimV/HubP family polar landmark protein [Rubrivivax sp.]
MKAGDTLSRIAARTQRPGVSLDQMLVALFRGNPDAFMGDNMNRLKSGVVLNVPSADEAGKVAAGEARETIQAQSADFAAYRQRLAAGTTTTADQTPARQATGKVQAAVEDRKQAAATSPDKLTLSQGGVKAGAEAKISKEAEKKDSGTRLAELSRNVEELKKLQQGASAPAVAPKVAAAPAPAPKVAAAPRRPRRRRRRPAAASSAPPPPPTPSPSPVATPSPSPVATPTPAPSPSPVPTPAAAPVAPPVASAPPPAPVVAPPKPAALPPPAEEPGFIATLLENPLVLPGAGVLVALLAGLGLYRLRGRLRKQSGETSFLESRLQPDSFFGASGGQRIDTREAASTSSGAVSSMSYSLSQLDAIGDVDPVAEADVYLAYGRDLQAEEILKEAMRASPERMAIRIKLLEVYVKRRDIKGFELLATQVYTLTRGTGEDWAKAQELGRQIDPDNALYQPGGAPDLAVGPSGKMIEPLDATTMPHTAKPSLPVFQPAPDATLDHEQEPAAAAEGPVDLELDIGAGGHEAPAPVHPEATLPVPNIAMLEPQPDSPPTLPAMPRVEPPTQRVEPPKDMGALDFDLGDMDLGDAKPSSGGGGPRPPDSTMDFSEFGLDTTDSQHGTLSGDGDPLARKLELAEEFRQIGDLEGARDLLEEVVAKAEGALKTKAQGMLSTLG